MLYCLQKWRVLKLLFARIARGPKEQIREGITVRSRSRFRGGNNAQKEARTKKASFRAQLDKQEGMPRATTRTPKTRTEAPEASRTRFVLFLALDLLALVTAARVKILRARIRKSDY